MARPKAAAAAKTKNASKSSSHETRPPPRNPDRFKALPNEVISRILVARVRESFLNGDDWKDEPDDSDSDGDLLGLSKVLNSKPKEWRYAPMILSAVCKRFREIALSTPSLWAKMDTFKTHLKRYDWLLLCLERNKTGPIQLSVSWPVDTAASKEDLDCFIAVVMPHIARWESITFVAEPATLVLLFIERMKAAGPAPLLESIFLCSNTGIDERDSEIKKNFLAKKKRVALSSAFAPKLKTFMSWGIPLAWDSFSFPQLKTLELNYQPDSAHYTWTELSRMLASAPNLEHLIIREPVLDPIRVDPIILDSLKTLKLHDFKTVEAFNLIVHFIRAPHLESLSLRGLVDEDFAPAIQWLAGTPRGHGYKTVTNLCLSDIEIYTRNEGIPAYAELFSTMPKVQRLFVDFGGSHDMSMLMALGGTKLLPKLKTFRSSELPEDRLGRFLLDRKALRAKIETLLLDVRDEWDKDDLKGLKKMISGEIKMCIPVDDEFRDEIEA